VALTAVTTGMVIGVVIAWPVRFKRRPNVAAASHAPFVSNVSAKMFNMDSYTELSNPRYLAKVFDSPDYAAWKSFRNLGERVRIVLPEEINTYDVLLSDTVVFSSGTLATTIARLDGGSAEEAS